MMKKIRIALIALSALYVVLTIIFMLNDESLFNNFNLLKLIDYLQAWIVVGLILLVAVIIAGSLYIRSIQNRYKKLEKEHNTVKSRVYEIEEERNAEKIRQQSEEEETERKLEAFNASIIDKRKDKTNPSETITPADEEPINQRPEQERPVWPPERRNPDSDAPDPDGDDPNDDKPVQL